MNNDIQMKRLAGWGNTAASNAKVVSFAGVDSLSVTLNGVNPRGAIARGLGRSYGAPAQNAGGTVILMEDDGEASLVLDSAKCTVTADARVSLDRIMRELIPRGWFVPVTPGTRQVTVGGAIASDIHGKNHHVDGSFGAHVQRMSLMTSEGVVRELSPTSTPREFWATVGGMGLTGVILDATFSMLPIETSLMKVETSRAANLDELMQTMSNDDEYRYSVAWIDLLARGTRMGRGVLTRGDHAKVADLGGREAQSPLDFEPKSLITAPPIFPSGLLNRFTVAAFNEAWFRKAPSRTHIGNETITTFFHPLDGVQKWNRLYGRAGFVQYQFVLPFEAADTMRAIIGKLSNAKYASFLAVLKYFGRGDAGHLSFPMPGWTLALDVPVGGRSMPATFGEIDMMVLDAGGRHYLAKDSHISAESVRRGYPRLAEWQAIRDEMDPRGIWHSDLSRRLKLTTK